LVVAIALSTVAFTSAAMAGKGGGKGSNFAAPRVRLAPARVRFLKAIQQHCPRGNNSIRIEMH
jgi:hypothetical protein